MSFGVPSLPFTTAITGPRRVPRHHPQDKAANPCSLAFRLTFRLSHAAVATQCGLSTQLKPEVSA